MPKRRDDFRTKPESIVEAQTVTSEIAQRGGEVDRRRVFREFFSRFQESQAVL
jgi:hypothetical protein